MADRSELRETWGGCALVVTATLSTSSQEYTDGVSCLEHQHKLQNLNKLQNQFPDNEPRSRTAVHTLGIFGGDYNCFEGFRFR